MLLNNNLHLPGDILQVKVFNAKALVGVDLNMGMYRT